MVLVMNYRSLRHSYCCFSCFPIYDYCRLLLMVPTPTLITLIRCSQHRCCRVIMLLLFSLLTMIMSLFGLSPRTFLCVRVRAWQGIRRWRIGGDLCWPGGRMVAGGERGRRVFFDRDMCLYSSSLFVLLTFYGLFSSLPSIFALFFCSFFYSFLVVLVTFLVLFILFFVSSLPFYWSYLFPPCKIDLLRRMQKDWKSQANPPWLQKRESLPGFDVMILFTWKRIVITPPASFYFSSFILHILLPPLFHLPAAITAY